MQALLSRAAQAQSSCRCRVCQHSTNALARRSTTAAPRRRITAADLFTACYTTILGTATVIDARRKNERRRKLDTELDHARASLHQLVVASPQTAVDGDHGVLDREASATSQLVREITAHAANDPARTLREELQSLCNIAYRPVARPSWMPDQFDWDSVEAAVAAEEQDPNTALREPQTDHHLAEAMTTTLNLVNELLRRTETCPGQQPQNQADIPDHAGDRILQELDDLKNGRDFPSYQSPAADPSYTTRIRALLNESIRLIFMQAVTPRELVGRICYNLLTVGVPPAIHTYNNLIIGFSRMQREDLAEAVIDSYLRETNWPATDQTVVCLLAHYRRPGGQEGMFEAVRRIWGTRVDRLQLASLHRDLRMRDLRNPRHPTSKRKYPLQRGRGTLLVKRNDATFDHLIRGWLYHGEIDFACMSFVACLRNGSSIPIYTLQELFRGCLATADFANARKLVTGIIRNFQEFQQYLLAIVHHNATTAVQELLQSLCQIINICWLPFGEIFGETYQTYASATVPLKGMIRQLDVQLGMKEAAQLTTLLSDTLSSDESLLSRLELAISSLDKAKLVRPAAAIYEDVHTRVARVISIDKRYRDLEERTRHLDAAYNAVIISIRTGYDIDPRSLLLSDRVGLNHRPTQDTRLALRRALSQVKVHDDLLTLEDVASQLFRLIPNENLIRQLEANGNWKRLSMPVLVSFFGEDAVSRRGVDRKQEQFNALYEQLQAQIREARDYLRALVFTYVSTEIQSRSMAHYGNYYNIPLWRLRSHLHTELKYELSSVLRGSRRRDRPFHPHKRKALLQSGLKKLAIQDGVMPFKADVSMSDTKTQPDRPANAS
ncbi:hypothetical protein F4803DRAFT_524789 [Xylaria telfairii]|nr:hypothetical protein F4803DRAFT_524789 [Xylaria telfairii]